MYLFIFSNDRQLKDVLLVIISTNLSIMNSVIDAKSENNLNIKIDCCSNVLLSLISEFQAIYDILDEQFSRKSNQSFRNNYLTPLLYWLIIDSLYFNNPKENYQKKIKSLQNKMNIKWKTLEDINNLDCYKFIIKIRKLIYMKKKSNNFEEILKTNINEIIKLLEELELEQKIFNNQKINLILNKIKIKSKQQLEEQSKLGTILHQKSNHLSKYSQFYKLITKKMVNQYQQQLKKPKCQICCLTNKVLKCQFCNFYVHAYCYPRNLNSQIFKCENCLKNIPSNSECELCPCIGGQYLETSDSISFPQFCIEFMLCLDTLQTENTLKFKICKSSNTIQLKKFVHLSCFLWQFQCDYNNYEGLVEGIHRVDRKKIHMLCYICGVNQGITISCNNEGCRRNYHPECALRSKLSIKIVKANNKVLRQFFCERHSSPIIYQALTEIPYNHLKDIKKFTECIDYQIKRTGWLSNSKSKHNSDEDYQDTCQLCHENNDFSKQIQNCSSCYGWYHRACSYRCLKCF